jgi:hypothetical protein
VQGSTEQTYKLETTLIPRDSTALHPELVGKGCRQSAFSQLGMSLKDMPVEDRFLQSQLSSIIERPLADNINLKMLRQKELISYQMENALKKFEEIVKSRFSIHQDFTGKDFLPVIEEMQKYPKKAYQSSSVQGRAG